MPSTRTTKGIIFDLGDVLFTWSPNTSTSIPAKQLRHIISSSIWAEYECGRLTRDVCYNEIAQKFSLDAPEISKAFAQARSSLQPNPALVGLLRNLRKDPHVGVYAMSNIGNEDFAALTEMMDWSLFDRVFTSGAASMRKPEHDFYRYVLQEIQLSPEHVVFVDDKPENVAAARMLGIKGIVFENNATDLLLDIYSDPHASGKAFLRRNAKAFNSITNTGVVVHDNFSQLLILEAASDSSLVNLEWGCKKTWNFFLGKPTLIQGSYFPDDLDTTSLALTTFPPPQLETVTLILDEMLGYVKPDGTFQTYFDHSKPRTDAVVTANVLTCFYTFGRGSELPQTLKYVHEVLLNREYLQGTRYYSSPDVCLWFFTRLLEASDDVILQVSLRSLLKSRVQERLGQPGDALALAMRVLACNLLDVSCDEDRNKLLDSQRDDGGWEEGHLYRYGSTGVDIGNRGVTTALALKAIRSMRAS